MFLAALNLCTIMKFYAQAWILIPDIDLLSSIELSTKKVLVNTLSKKMTYVKSINSVSKLLIKQTDKYNTTPLWMCKCMLSCCSDSVWTYDVYRSIFSLTTYDIRHIRSHLIFFYTSQLSTESTGNWSLKWLFKYESLRLKNVLNGPERECKCLWLHIFTLATIP